MILSVPVDNSPLQKFLNTKYDKFVERYGYIMGKSNMMVLCDDNDYSFLCSLEEVDEESRHVL